MINIFAATITSKSGLFRLYATGIFYACTLQTICGSVPPCGVVNAPTALGVIVSGKGGAVFISAKKNNFLRDMTITETNCLNVNNSTVPATSAHETCEKFIAFIRERYPQIQSPHFKITKNGKLLTIRAAFHRRRIFAYGRDFEKTISYFTNQCINKMSMEKYYPSVAEAKEMKLFEPFCVKIKCAVLENMCLKLLKNI